MRMIKLIRHFFNIDKKFADAIAESVDEGMIEAFKEREYPFTEE
jgi:hypothetical protein